MGPLIVIPKVSLAAQVQTNQNSRSAPSSVPRIAS
jgi:hypothetical protein